MEGSSCTTCCTPWPSPIDHAAPFGLLNLKPGTPFSQGGCAMVGSMIVPPGKPAAHQGGAAPFWRCGLPVSVWAHALEGGSVPPPDCKTSSHAMRFFCDASPAGNPGTTFTEWGAQPALGGAGGPSASSPRSAGARGDQGRGAAENSHFTPPVALASGYSQAHALLSSGLGSTEISGDIACGVCPGLGFICWLGVLPVRTTDVLWCPVLQHGGLPVLPVPQYDVRLVQGIERLIGRMLVECTEVVEGEVLKGITKVSHEPPLASVTHPPVLLIRAVCVPQDCTGLCRKEALQTLASIAGAACLQRVMVRCGWVHVSLSCAWGTLQVFKARRAALLKIHETGFEDLVRERQEAKQRAKRVQMASMS